MQFIAYMNHPLRTVTAKQSQRDALGAAMAAVKIKPAEEHRSEPRPERKHTGTPRTKARETNGMSTDQLFSVVPVEQVARSIGLSVQECAKWGARVPVGYQLFLAELISHYPVLAKAQAMLVNGMRSSQVGRQLGTTGKALNENLAYFGMKPSLN